MNSLPLRALLGENSFWARDLAEFDRGKPFKCPICKEEFIVVLPRKNIIKHFRHRSGKEHWEPETFEHLQAKMTVYEQAMSLGWEANLEEILGPYITDVVLRRGNFSIAVECQCSSVSIDAFQSKDSFYRTRGIIPLWIFGGNYWQHTKHFLTWIKAIREPSGGYWDDKPIYETTGYKTYKIQKIKKIEQLFLSENRSLWFFGNSQFYIGDFNYRWNSEVLGWYVLHKIPFQEILSQITWNVTDNAVNNKKRSDMKMAV